MATYYIDFVGGADANAGTSTGAAWKRAPGMTGFTGAYVHAAGDRFVFKGGAAWTAGVYPWTVANSGGSGNPDVYTTDHTWFTGGSFTQPIFDAQATEPAGGMLQASGKNDLTFNDLAFTNYATTGVAENKKALDFTDCQGLSFTNNTFTCFCWITLYIHWVTSGTYTNFVITGNDVSHTSSFVWFATAASNTTRQTISVTGNTIHDFTSQLGGGVHGDGFWHSFGPNASDTTCPLLGLQFANNYAYGDFRRSFGATGGMTAFIFTEDVSQVTAQHINNVYAPSPTQAGMFQGYVVAGSFAATSVVEYYNNSMYAATSPGFGLDTGGSGTHIVKNNIATGLDYAVNVENTTGTFTFDNNVWNSNTGQLIFGAAFQTYAQWQAAGRDQNSVLGVDPLYRNPPSDLRLQSTSQGIGEGGNLTSVGYVLLNSDKDGVARPASGPWDAGAYEVTTTPTTPTAASAPAAGRAVRVMRSRHARWR